MNEPELEYVGFWPRVGAAIIDTILLLIICAPLVIWIYGAEYWVSARFIAGPADFCINWVAPAIAVVLFWIYRQAMPGKMAIVPLMLGIIWVGLDARKQGFHDKLARTLVVRAK